MKHLDAITNEQVQRLKLTLAGRSPKTVNNLLTLMSTLLKKAMKWGELERLPCTIKLLRNPGQTMGFHDFAQYERLLMIGRKRGAETYPMIPLGGDASAAWRDRRAQVGTASALRSRAVSIRRRANHARSRD